MSEIMTDPTQEQTLMVARWLDIGEVWEGAELRRLLGLLARDIGAQLGHGKYSLGAIGATNLGELEKNVAAAKELLKAHQPPAAGAGA